MPLQPGQLLNNRYQIISLLGQGGMGSVYRAVDSAINNTVAIKEQRPDANATPATLAQARLQFQREAQALARMNHPNLPRVTDYFSLGGNEYLVMDFVDGQDLETIAQQNGTLPEATVLSWAFQLLDALTYIHGLGVIHRDIKPHNVILKPDGRITLVDFGLVKLLDPNNPNTATAMRGLGTPEYAPFEQYASGAGHTDARSDIYSLGAMLYRLLTGRAPIEVHQRVLNPAALPALRLLNPNISTRTEAAILKAMEIHPQDRFASPAEMKQALSAQLAVSKTTQQAGGVQSQQTAKRNFAVLVGTALLAAVCIAAGLPFIIPFASVPAATTPTTSVVSVAITVIVTPTRNSAPLVLGAPPSAASPQRRGNDNAEMVFVPAGEFVMGSNDGASDEKPLHTVTLDAFWIDKYEITNALYKKCVDAKKCLQAPLNSSNTRSSYYNSTSFEKYPKIYVTWNDANAYCSWAGKRLPTEAEWEKAARGTDGRSYPWGNIWDGMKLNSWEADPRPNDTTAVGSYPSGASPFGVLDMAGNVKEWLADWYDPNYYTNAPRSNPKGPPSGTFRVIRGGSWLRYQLDARSARRIGNTNVGSSDVGFRCATNP